MSTSENVALFELWKKMQISNCGVSNKTCSDGKDVGVLINSSTTCSSNRDASIQTCMQQDQDLHYHQAFHQPRQLLERQFGCQFFDQQQLNGLNMANETLWSLMSMACNSDLVESEGKPASVLNTSNLLRFAAPNNVDAAADNVDDLSNSSNNDQQLLEMKDLWHRLVLTNSISDENDRGHHNQPIVASSNTACTTNKGSINESDNVNLLRDDDKRLCDEAVRYVLNVANKQKSPDDKKTTEEVVSMLSQINDFRSRNDVDLSQYMSNRVNVDVGVVEPSISTVYTQKVPEQDMIAAERSGHVIEHQMRIPNDLIGCIIGRGGSKINDIRVTSRAKIKISDASNKEQERTITIHGKASEIHMAIYLINNSIELHKHLLALNTAMNFREDNNQPVNVMPVELQDYCNRSSQDLPTCGGIW